MAGALGTPLKLTAGIGLLTAALSWITGRSDSENSWNPLSWIQNIGDGEGWLANNTGTAAGLALFAGLWSMPKAFNKLTTPLMSLAGIYTAYSFFKGTTSTQFNSVAQQVAELGADLGIDLNTSGAGTNNRLRLSPEQMRAMAINVNVDALTSDPTNVAQVAGVQNVAFLPDGTPYVVDDSPEPDAPSLDLDEVT